MRTSGCSQPTISSLISIAGTQCAYMVEARYNQETINGVSARSGRLQQSLVTLCCHEKQLGKLQSDGHHILNPSKYESPRSVVSVDSASTTE